MRYAAYIAFFLSGASSLIFQNIWSRMLHHVFGATSIAISSVITAFMIGLGLGAFIAGRYADRIKHPIITYGVAELFVGGWALLVPWLIDPEGWLAGVNQWLRIEFGAESFTFMFVRFGLVLPILLVPTTLMGTTLPLLARHFIQTQSQAGKAASSVGVLYAINTFGAVAGINLAAFILMPTIGLAATNYVALSMNLCLGLGIFAFRGVLLKGMWTKGEKLQWLPAPKPAAGAKDPQKPGETAAKPEPAEQAAEERSAESTGESTAPEKSTRSKKASKKGKKSAPAKEIHGQLKKRKDERNEPQDEITTPIPALARKAAYVAFAASGAAALCYEVVWTRALAMTIGSSIYSFAIILETFLIGIAGGSALCAAFLVRGTHRLTMSAVAAALLICVANVPLAVDGGIGMFVGVSVCFMLPVILVYATVLLRARTRTELPTEAERTRPALIIAAVPALAAIVNVLAFEGELAFIASTVSLCLCLYIVALLTLRRFPVLLVAVIQFLIALSTIANYLYQDDIPIAFASLVTTLGGDLPDHVGTVQFFMFVTAGFCTLPAALGMGAMFPLTIRIWTSGGGDIGRDVGTVYAGNTVGSIIGAWLPGFILMPWIGIQATLVVGIILNLLLAIGMLVICANDSERQLNAIAEAGVEKKVGAAPFAFAAVALIALGGAISVPIFAEEFVLRAGAGMLLLVVAVGAYFGLSRHNFSEKARAAVWHVVTIYVLAPLIPALIAVLIMGQWVNNFLHWDQSQMTLGVFRISTVEGLMANRENWGGDIVFYKDGLSTTVSVERFGTHYAMKNNGKVDASNGEDMPTQIMVAGFPLLMHQEGPENLDVAVIGFGSGVTVGAALEFPVASVDVLELERNILKASQFFDDVNHLQYTLPDFPWVQEERLTVYNDDGRNYLASTDRTYDIIMSEPSNPWITGVSDLFTTDHFRITKQRLREHGIYCQWVQLYELSPENIKTIYATFASQFEHVIVFSAEDLSSDTVMLGSDSPLTMDVGRIQAIFDDPSISAELERAYIHSPFDVFARTILASREEILGVGDTPGYTHVEQRMRDGDWISFPETSNDPTRACDLPECRRLASPLNTDDNALIEFAAPRDLIGFGRYEGYLANIYSPEWPWGRLVGRVENVGTGEVAARNYAEMAMALIAHGRKIEASDFIQQSLEFAQVREALVATETLTLLLSDEHEPTITIEPPVPGPQMERRMAERLTEGFQAVREAIDSRAYGTALAAMENIPAPLRQHNGPSLRFLYGYLLYKAAEGSGNRYSGAIEQFEDLVRDDELYVRRHPELYYFLGRAHDADFNFDKALRNMRLFVEARVIPAEDQIDLPEPPLMDAPTTDEPGESPKDRHLN